MHIAIAGNIGSGKTTLTKLLSKRYGWKPNFEPVDNNPYLADYYKDMERWSFNLQIYFLNKRFHDVVEISKSEENIIQDRTIFEDAKIFAPNLHEIGMMSDRDFANYTDLFDLMISLVKLPDLMIYIRSSIPTLVSHIERRAETSRRASASTTFRDSTIATKNGSRTTRASSSSSMATTSTSRRTQRTSARLPTR